MYAYIISLLQDAFIENIHSKFLLGVFLKETRTETKAWLGSKLYL